MAALLLLFCVLQLTLCRPNGVFLFKNKYYPTYTFSCKSEIIAAITSDKMTMVFYAE